MDNLEKEIYARNIGVITPEEQIKLKNITVTVIGAGGVG
jgi:tRNA A37 threonylcarbamoyladenosine dehydratase